MCACARFRLQRRRGNGSATGSAPVGPGRAAMIPPADSLLRYETPVLVSRNTEKRSPKVGGGRREGIGGQRGHPRVLTAPPLRRLGR